MTIVEGRHRVCVCAGVAPGAITQIFHGPTLASDGLIERRGAKPALITAQGLGDVTGTRRKPVRTL